MLLQNRLLHIIAILVLVFIQITVLNNIQFLGVANPYFYIILILLLPLSINRYLLLCYAFITGIAIDIFEFTGGINAFSTVFIAFIKPFLAKLINTQNTLDNEDVKLYHFNFFQWFLYLSVSVFMHHFIILFLERFDISFIQSTLVQSLIGSAITLVLIALYLMFFPPKRKSEF